MQGMPDPQPLILEKYEQREEAGVWSTFNWLNHVKMLKCIPCDQKKKKKKKNRSWFVHCSDAHVQTSAYRSDWSASRANDQICGVSTMHITCLKQKENKYAHYLKSAWWNALSPRHCRRICILQINFNFWFTQASFHKYHQSILS